MLQFSVRGKQTPRRAWRYKANLAMSGLRRDRLRQRAVLLRVAAAGCCCVCCLHPGSHRLEAEQSGAAQTQETRETEAQTGHWSLEIQTKAILRFVITEKAPTRAFSWLKAASTAFTFKTLSRHYANQALSHGK